MKLSNPSLSSRYSFFSSTLFAAALACSTLALGSGCTKKAEETNQAATATTDAQTQSSPTPASSLAATTTPPLPDSHSSPVKSNPNPDLTTDANGLSKATVTLSTKYGDVKFKFYPKDAPNTVKRMIELINQGFYNGLSFHRVVPNFVIQGGDPQGNGTGGSGQRLKAEFNERKHIEGAVAMARAADPDSADSQFYITLAPQPHLDHNYTVFGQVVEGMDTVRKIQPGDKMITIYIE